MALEAVVCDVCGERVPQSGGRGRHRMRHPRCKAFTDALGVVRRYLTSITVANEATEQLRYRLFCMVTGSENDGGYTFPRVRNAKGQFVGRRDR